MTPTPAQEARLAKVTELILKKTETASKDFPQVKEVLVGGSFAKGTWLPEEADIDIFVKISTEVDDPTFEEIGLQLMNRTRGSADFGGDPIASVLQDRAKRAYAAQILGQAFVTAENFVAANKPAVEKIAEAVIEKQELYGDDLNRLLNSVDLKKPEIDWTKEETWPKM